MSSYTGVIYLLKWSGFFGPHCTIMNYYYHLQINADQYSKVWLYDSSLFLERNIKSNLTI